MRRPQTLPAFTAGEYEAVHHALASKVAFMMGRKLEEGDWTEVYCRGKNIPVPEWSNLNLDVIHNGLGLEIKLYKPGRQVSESYGLTFMHPALTRSIRIPATEDAYSVMQEVLGQYASNLQARREFVANKCSGCDVSMRTGWLLWQTDLRDFVYFEEETLAPDPGDYIAEWHRNPAKGQRKATRSLWLYDKETKQKRYSVTTDAGAKIQPYFDVPPQSDPHVYFFRVQGEEIVPGLVRLWVPASTAMELKRLIGSLETNQLDTFIADTIASLETPQHTYERSYDKAVAIEMSVKTYGLLAETFTDAVNDAHIIQMLLHSVSM